MWEAPLLELDHIDIRLHNAQDVFLCQHIFHRLQLGFKHPGHNIWPILRGLAWKQRILYLLPVWVAGHRQEDVRLAVRLYLRHGVHMPPLHVSEASLKTPGENNPCANSACSSLSGCDAIDNAFI